MTSKRIVFRLTEESSSGGTGCSWVEKRRDGYHFHHVETGHAGGPYKTPLAALCCDGWQFGMSHVTIESSLPVDEFRQALGNLIMGNVTLLLVNGVQLKNPTIDSVLAAYVPA